MPADVLPKLGLGTSQNDDPDECARTVATALDLGYRHVDTAKMYGNEAYVGDGLARSDGPREDVIVATKIDEAKNSYDGVLETTQASLGRLGVETIDLLYVHWPINDYAPEETLPAFNELYDEGTIRYAGVSNFEADQVEAALDHLDVPLVANQVEMHPLLPPRETHLESARRHDYHLVAYSPFCRAEAFGTEELVAVAEKHGVSEAQVCLAWLCGHDTVVAIPKSRGRDPRADNHAALALERDPSDIDRIDSI
jgi:2,5-diketo-D-gluconate reductase B